MPPQLVPLRQFARDHNVSMATVYRLLEKEELRAVKLGTRTYVTEEEAERFRNGLQPYAPSGVPLKPAAPDAA